MGYVLGNADRELLQRMINKVRRTKPLPNQYKRRRGKIGKKGKASPGGGDVQIVLIDEDIDPGAEDEDPFFEVDPDGTEGDGEVFNLWAFAPVLLDLKYYIPVESSDSIYDASTFKMKLAYEDNGTDGITYLTKEVYYFDKKPFILTEYGLSDYPDFPENEVWPPPHLDPVGTENDFSLKKRYRAQAKPDASGRLWLDVSTCYALPPPTLPEEP